MTDAISSKCKHTVHPNGIHEFSIADSSTSSAEAYMQELEKIYKLRTPDSPTLRILFDAGQGTMPISFTMQRGKDLATRYPDIGKIRIASLTDKFVEIRIVDSFLRMVRFSNTSFRFFELSRRDDALNWLLKDD
jgi:hypothetical protein